MSWVAWAGPGASARSARRVLRLTALDGQAHGQAEHLHCLCTTSRLPAYVLRLLTRALHPSPPSTPLVPLRRPAADGTTIRPSGAAHPSSARSPLWRPDLKSSKLRNVVQRRLSKLRQAPQARASVPGSGSPDAGSGIDDSTDVGDARLGDTSMTSEQGQVFGGGSPAIFALQQSHRIGSSASI